MADIANVFEKGVDYRDRFIEKYGRKCNLPSVMFLDAKFHPTLPDHVIVLSSVTFPNSSNLKVNMLIPSQIVNDMEKKIEQVYYKQAQNEYYKQNRTTGTEVPKKPDEDIKDPFLNDSQLEDFEGGSSSKEQSGGSEDDEQYDDDSNQDEYEESEDEEDSKEEAQHEIDDESNYHDEIMKSAESNSDLHSGNAIKDIDDAFENPISRKLTKGLSEQIAKIKWMRKRENIKLSRKNLEERNIYDKAIELYIRDNYDLFKYQGYNRLLTNQDQDSEERSDYEQNSMDFEMPSKEDFDEFESSGTKFSLFNGWKGCMYIPPVFKESYQLSMWKIEQFGVVKVMNKYFTPKTSKATGFDFPGFTLELSLDEQTMLMVEKDHEKHKELVVISFDMYTLEILNEMCVSVVDESIRNESFYQGKSSEQDMYYKGPFLISDKMSKISSWNFGKYLISGVSTSCQSRIIYKFMIYNLKTSSLICTIDRNASKYLKEKIISITCESEREEILHFVSTFNNKDLIVLEVNVITSKVIPKVRYPGLNTIYAFPTENKRFIYVIHKDLKTKLYVLYCLMYQFEFEDKEEKAKDNSKGTSIICDECKLFV